MLRIIQEYPRLARNAHGSDREYVEWFKLALDECRQGHYFYGLDEYFNPLREGYIALTGVEGRGLPLPPQAIATPNHSIKGAQKPRMGTKKGTAHRRSHNVAATSWTGSDCPVCGRRAAV